MTVTLIDAPFAGRPTRLQWRNHRWICREPACEVVSFLEQNPQVAAPRGRLTTRAASWAIRQLRYENASIQGLARQLGTTWNTLWSQGGPRLADATADPARFDGIEVLGVDEHIRHHTNPRRRGPKELTGMVDLSRSRHPHSASAGSRPWTFGEGEKTAKEARFEKFEDAQQSFDEAAYERAMKLTGYKGYVTNIERDIVSAGEVIGSYHDLWHVEQSFRMSKTDLAARPIFHCTVTGASLKKIVTTLRPLREFVGVTGGHEITFEPEVPAEAAALIAELDQASCPDRRGN